MKRFYLDPKTGERIASGSELYASIRIETPIGGVDTPLILIAAIRGGAPIEVVAIQWCVMFAPSALPDPRVMALALSLMEGSFAREKHRPSGLTRVDLN